MWGLRGLFGCKFVEPVENDLYVGLLPQLQGMHRAWPTGIESQTCEFELG